MSIRSPHYPSDPFEGQPATGRTISAADQLCDSIPFKRPHDLSRLHDELLAAGISVESVEEDYRDPVGEEPGLIVAEPVKDGIRVTVLEGTDKSAVQAVIDAHDPAPRETELPVVERVAQVLATAPELSEATRTALIDALTG